jgi:sensor histidine kinase YesM
MTVYNFIFTTKRPGKYLRHIVFWIAQAFFWGLWADIFFVSFKQWLSFTMNFYLNVPFLLGISYTYLIVYYLFPEYFVHKRYVRSIILLSVFTLVTYFFYILHHFHAHNILNNSKDVQLLMGWFFTMNFIINGPPVICAMFLTIKMLKTYYVKMEEKRILANENVQAELQLLKAQVHPHFLFNTLNNIYSFVLTQSPDAGSLVLKLSHTLRYMINECEADLVPLEKEIQLLRNYIGLEKVRYGNRLHLEVNITGDYANKMIAPLLMIPFVENSFKHGISMMRGRQWIHLELNVHDKQLYFNIGNSKPMQPVSQHGKEGIGLLNVQKRLQLIYPGKHHLTIESTDDVYIVHLQVALLSGPSETNNPIVPPQQLAYA